MKSITLSFALVCVLFGFSRSLAETDEEVRVEYGNECEMCVPTPTKPCQEYYIYTRIVNGQEQWRKVWRDCEDNSGLWEDTGWTPSVVPGAGTGTTLPSYIDSGNNLIITVSSGDGGHFSDNPLGSGLVFTANGSSTVLVPSNVLN